MSNESDAASEREPRQDAGQDASIAERLERDPEDVDARLDEALDETMDVSDPVSLTTLRPGGTSDEVRGG
ncbi:hypothetical protein SAMN06297144_1204 [Sphingomonas guangdongensis]|uniref:Uncharacterized protein n=1 Tax=Sphingomonas guangdongensis TaxID=1141890 RepID=A0A285QGT3_9SPHN|nr:hypothetical protein [Sphingomonas guangdongensis]SOB80718.1 hypothetical protein SAMN06297144_1204 [Sphingomonas guangdongensis]